MEEKIPRRMMRFYRKQGEAEQNYTSGYNEGYDTTKNVPTKEKENNFSPSGRPVLREIPSMGYEDLDEATKKKYAELKKVEEENTARKMALEEVENFKKKNNRMPNQTESEQIAENLYTQLKNVDTDKLYGVQGQGTQRVSRVDAKRARKNEGQKKEDELLAPSPKQNTPQDGIADIKSLLADDSDDNEGTTSTASSKSAKDEFDLGLDEESNNDTAVLDTIENENIEDLPSGGGSICPNCKKDTEKIIYCPKCGAAFCEKCAKKEANAFICPKCKMKVKV